MIKYEKPPEIKSFDDVDKALLLIGRAEAVRTKEEAMMNKKIQNITEEYKEKVKDELALVADLELAIQDWCSKNKREFEVDKRTIELFHGSVGFRTNPPKVLQLSNKFKVATTIEFIKKLWGKQKDLFIRTKEEINKEAILGAYVTKEKSKELKEADLKSKLTDEALASVGLRIEQDDTFKYEIKWDSLDSDAVA